MSTTIVDSFHDYHVDMSEMKFPLITVYDKTTSDFQGRFVARLFDIRDGKSYVTSVAVVADKYEDIISKIPERFNFFNRNESDDPVILGVWI
ncbi:hypothetical protein PTI45_03964 [Paenibacillus nuruki]|uniref:Uncharacterized protein n=1 Tax=Paenibacillus nuruki TaxID=1886670 RepID=A0A1E3L0H4_9BACL|nr:hypothetical protein [Paenibacillus nuruki]ODP26685.1 hypothetical protein PTI45_03964 [Paenibacillus nuruki]